MQRKVLIKEVAADFKIFVKKIIIIMMIISMGALEIFVFIRNSSPIVIISIKTYAINLITNAVCHADKPLSAK
jgi:hypothetical protein